MQRNPVFTRWFFILASICIITLILWNTFVFFQQLKENERAKMLLWASAQEELAVSGLDAKKDIDLVLNIIRTNTSTPMLLYYVEDKVYEGNNIEEEAIDSPEKIEKLIERFSSEYKPIEIRDDNDLLSIVYYGNSPLINKLKYYPAMLVVIIILFFLAIYFFYKTSKSAEQNRLWAGMAKETAHQIGTPLSSLVGWTEILKTENVNPSYITEIEKDITRLETITNRFSKIGSVPALTRTDIVSETKNTFNYLKIRTSKLIIFKLNIPEEPIYVQLNPELFSWTFENLVKNGIDAMKGKGTITISLEKIHKNVHIRISDTGKGISKNNFSRVFSPGFTTKKRGWGLGLSLAKRIVEEYHNGKIRVLKSTLGKGTTMEIVLRTDDAS